MIIRQWCALVFGCSLVSADVYGQQLPTTEEVNRQELRAVIQNRIENANSTFRDRVEKFPDQNLSVTTSLRRSMPIWEVVSAAQQHGLTIEGFRHGDASQSGGYTMTPGESVEDAVRQYEYDMEYFSRMDLQYTYKMLQDVNSDIERRALNRRKEDILARQQKYNNEGLKILGIDLHGKAESLDTFATETGEGFVRVMEIRESERRNAAILPAD